MAISPPEWSAARQILPCAKSVTGASLARAVDLTDAIVIEDTRYDEARFRLYGQIDGEWHCAAVTLREDSVRIINLRRAHSKEVKRNV